MPFERGMREIVSVTTWLEANGWLAEILGAWQKNYTDERLTIVEKILDEVGGESRSSVLRAARLPDYRPIGRSRQPRRAKAGT